ncbi:DNA/RNA non-specific endonuclease [Fluviicola sp.]|uniref:DNA/RNA non-specific endonuclease n=1 Tax=Fluviicola sp. TaxID=1917219 RepID=UPI0031D868D7
MKNETLFTGYKSDFLQTGKNVEMPILSEDQRSDLAPVDGNPDGIVNYINYSLMLSVSHKFPFFTATNMNGKDFRNRPRKDNWRDDDRVKKYQWGKTLYSAARSDFDRGHMTKREDVQWGESDAIASAAADSTFFYSNAVPQHKDLNQVVWRSLEDYILHSETKEHKLRVCVFTGPILSDKNPIFVTKVDSESVRIPILFWKVVVFPKSDGNHYRVGFIMSQRSLLKDNKIINQSAFELESDNIEDRLFLNFKDADTYQVNVSLIEQLSGLKMPEAKDVYTDDRSIKLVLEEVDISNELESDSLEYRIGYSINMSL